jgi:hypothetical protein
VEVAAGVLVPFIGPERRGGGWSEGKWPVGGGVLLHRFSNLKRGEGRRGGVVLVGEMKKVGRRFGSDTHTWRRAIDGGAGRGGAGSGEIEEEECPGGLVMGRKAKTSWTSTKIFQGEWFGLQISFGPKWKLGFKSNTFSNSNQFKYFPKTEI